MTPPDLSPTVQLWWTALRAVSVLNGAFWLFAFVNRRRDGRETRQLALSFLFVAGCAFRSWLPRADVQRICLVDSWLSSVLVGRSVATVAELCFVAQWAFLLRDLAERNRAKMAVVLSALLVPAIAVAETASWTAVLTTCYLGNVVEESIWTLCVASLVACGVVLLRRVSPALRRLLCAVTAAGAAYVAFMCLVDVPMYLRRWLADSAAGRAYLTPLAGIVDAATRWRVTGAQEAWRHEMPWMTLYFSAAVWMSVALTRCHRLIERQTAFDTEKSDPESRVRRMAAPGTA